MGGAEKLAGIKTLIMSGGTGTRTKVGQMTTATGPDQVGELTNNVETLDIVGGRAAFDYDIKVGDFVQHRHEVLTKFEGKPVGVESIQGVTFATTPGGLFSWGTQNSPEWLLKRNPVSVALAAAETASLSEVAQDKEFNGKMMKSGRGQNHEGEDVTFYFDPDTKLLAGFEVLDTESMLGNVTAEYTLTDYKDVSGVQLPHHIKIRKGGEDYSEIQYASIAMNDPKAEEVFVIPAEIAAQAPVAAAGPDAFPMTLKRVSDGVYQAQAFRHHSMVVEFPTFVAVVEAPYLETQTRVLAKAIEAQFPNKPIRYVAVTHFHYDHIGGVRAAAALGATILVAREHAPVLTKVLEAKHTHPRDDLESAREANKTVGAIEAFEGKKVIEEGGQSLELHTFTGSPHVEPLVVAYVPKGRALFQSDIWFPGTGGTGTPESAHLLDSIKKANLRVDQMVGGHGGVGPFAELTRAIAAMK
jgi:glyoxylase-like metal-dependent hydrolase (beta-lactamase superfamily II)